MEKFWNLIYYFAYIGDYKLHLLFNKINPVLFFYKLPYAKKHFKIMDVNPVNDLNKAFLRPDIGISSIRAGGLMMILVFLICLGIGNFYIGINRIRFNIHILPFIVAVAFTLIFNYLLLFRQNKYLNYFKDFDKIKDPIRKRYAWLSFGIILCILLFSVGSFIFMFHRL